MWYLGENVHDYAANGLVTTTEGTWRAGIEGPAAMIMPADPQVGDVNRPENIPGNVFEEVEVAMIDQTADGPSGPVSGVMVGTETHQDGLLSDKVFAPAPTDSLSGGVPTDLRTISEGADRIFGSRLSTPTQLVAG